MGACCVTSTGVANIEKERQVIAAERRALEAEKALYELQIKGGQAGNQQQVQVAPQPSTQATQQVQYLTAANIREGMAVRVTSDAAHLQRTCQQTGVLTHDQRLAYMGKPARVLEVDRSKNVAKVEWEDASGFMPIASLFEIPDGEAPAANPTANGLRQLLGALAMMQEGQNLPRETPRSSSDFHFHDTLRSINVDDRKKVAVCVQDRDATIVTAEVFEAAGSYEFLVRLSRPEGASGGDPFLAVGLVDDKPNGFSTHMIGKEDFKGAIGALCLGNSGGPGAMVHEGQIVGVAPPMQDGDLFGVLIRNGTAKFVKNGEMFHSVGLQGKFRFGVSLCRRQQSVEIVGTA